LDIFRELFFISPSVWVRRREVYLGFG